MEQIWQLASDYAEGDPTQANFLTGNYYRIKAYAGGIFKLVAGEVDYDFADYVNQNLNMTPDDIIPLIDPVTKKDNDIKHLLATAQTIYLFPDIPLVGTHVKDLAGWAGDLYTSISETFGIRDTYEGDLYEKTYNAAYDVIAAKDISSSFSYTDFISDVDGFNMGKIVTERGFQPLPDLMREYFRGDVSNRFESFYENRFNSDSDTLTNNAFKYLTGSGDLLAARYLISDGLSTPVPGYENMEAQAVSNAFRDKVLYYVNK
jgi:hypothetical protein